MVVMGWLTLKIWDEQIFGRQKLLDDDIKISMVSHRLEALKYVSKVVDVLMTNWQQSGIRNKINSKFKIILIYVTKFCHQFNAPSSKQTPSSDVELKCLITNKLALMISLKRL